jgi:hypothetical protein
MKRLLLAIIGVAIASASVYLYGCGALNPAYAPFGATITLVGYTAGGTITDTIQCNLTWGVPSTCMPQFTDKCVALCEHDLETQTGQTPSRVLRTQYNHCLEQTGATSQTCANLVCGSAGNQDDGWVTECGLPGSLTAAQTYVTNLPDCGSVFYLIPALVTLNEFTVTQSSTVSSTSTAGGEPQDNVQVRWVAQGGGMYKPSDVVGAVPPLSNPFYDRTDDRGLSEIKYQVSHPTTCGDTVNYTIGADIGVSAASLTISEVVATSTTTVDDDTVSDDDNDDNDNDDNDSIAS